MIILKTFYLFKLNKEYINIAKKEPFNIYILLSSINNHNKKEVNIAFNLFNEICLPINIEFINSYLFNKLYSLESYTKFMNVHMFHDYFSGEESKIIVNKTHIKIKSNIENSIFLSNLLYFNNLFLCNFNDDFYRFLGKNSEKIYKNTK